MPDEINGEAMSEAFDRLQEFHGVFTGPNRVFWDRMDDRRKALTSEDAFTRAALDGLIVGLTALSIQSRAS